MRQAGKQFYSSFSLIIMCFPIISCLVPSLSGILLGPPSRYVVPEDHSNFLEEAEFLLLSPGKPLQQLGGSDGGGGGHSSGGGSGGCGVFSLCVFLKYMY